MAIVSDRIGRSSDVARLVVVGASGISLWFAAFAKAQDFSGEFYPSMNGPLEFLFSQGRILSFGTMLVAVTISLVLGRGFSRLRWRNASLYVAAVNVFLLFKLMLYGNNEIFFQGSLAIIVQILLFAVFASAYERDELEKRSHTSHVVQVVYVFSALFIFTNIYVFAYFSGSSIVPASGRFFGITANPQHLAMSSALCVPVLLYCVVRYKIGSIVGIFAGLLALSVLFIEYQTGSRLGLGATAICIILASRYFLDPRRIALAVTFGALALSLSYVLFYDSISDLIWSRFVEGRTDTRSEYWVAGWDAFYQSPLVGIEPTGDPPKYYFTVSSWVSAAYSGGAIALGLLILFLLSVIGYILKINRLRSYRFVDKGYVDLYISAIAMIIVLSFLEAVFLGVFSSHTMLVYLYVAGAGSLVDSSKRLLYARHWQSIYARHLRVDR